MKPVARAMTASMVLAQVVGLFKVELTIQATQHIANPWLLRGVVYGVLGAACSVLVAWINVKVVRRLSADGAPHGHASPAPGP